MDNDKMYDLPIGVQNYLPQECYNKNRIENALFSEFSKWGYDRIEVAPLEFYDNFREGCFKIDGARMCKFSDVDGNMVVLTPDITMSIVKLASRGETLPVRYCYGGNVFDNNQSIHTNSRVQAQAGVELIGEAGVDADIEVLALAIECLKKSGVKRFKIDVGQVDYFKGILSEHNIDDLRLRQAVDRKDMLGVTLRLKELAANPAAYDAVTAVLSLFGGREVLARAKKLTKNETGLSAIEKLEQVLDRLTAYGYGDCLSVDLGIVSRLSYYSGIVFQGLTPHIGAPIMTGGRYDGLGGEFKKNFAATGFALDIKKLLIALEAEGGLESCPRVDLAVGGCGNDDFIFRYISGERAKGKRVLKIDCNSREELIDFMLKNKLSHGEFIDACDTVTKI